MLDVFFGRCLCLFVVDAFFCRHQTQKLNLHRINIYKISQLAVLSSESSWIFGGDGHQLGAGNVRLLGVERAVLF